MTVEEFEKDFEQCLLDIFKIEKQHMPRSSFAGINRNEVEKIKHTNNLKNIGFHFTKISDTQFTFWVDLARFPYAETINGDGYVTKGYWNKIFRDIAQRIAKRYNTSVYM